jgi:hypothetical protein
LTRLYRNKVRFVKEDRTPEQVVNLMKDVPEEKEGCELIPFLMFLTDEMVFFRDVCLKECMLTL